MANKVRLSVVVIGLLIGSELTAQINTAHYYQPPTDATVLEPEPFNAPSIIKPAIKAPVVRAPKLPSARSNAIPDSPQAAASPETITELPADEPESLPAAAPRSSALIATPDTSASTLRIKPVSPRVAAVPETNPFADDSEKSQQSDEEPAAVEPKSTEKSSVESDDLPIEVIRERYNNTMIKVERQVTQDADGNYLNHGNWVGFDERRRMIGGGEYRLGKREGKWSRWFAANEGQLFSGSLFKDFPAPFTSEAEFVADQLNGVWQVTDAKGRKVCEWHFENGLQHGKSLWYSPAGTIRREVTFEQGEPHGDVIEYGADGKVATREKFIHGRKLVTQVDWYEANIKRAEGSTLLAKEQVRSNFDFWNGRATFTVVGVEGKNQRHGKWSWWHKNGRKQMDGEFVFDQPTGEFTWWHANGQKLLVGNYIDGKQDGNFVWWHANGMKMMEGEYLAGVQINTWKRWHDDGKVRELARYSPTGEQIELKQFNNSTVSDQEQLVKDQSSADRPAAQTARQGIIGDTGTKRR